MGDMIARIVEVERQCADEVEKAERAWREKIETHRKTIEERKSRECARIVSEGEARLKEAVEEEKNKGEAALQMARGDIERLYRDPSLDRELQERIISILLEA